MRRSGRSRAAPFPATRPFMRAGTYVRERRHVRTCAKRHNSEFWIPLQCIGNSTAVYWKIPFPSDKISALPKSERTGQQGKARRHSNPFVNLISAPLQALQIIDQIVIILHCLLKLFLSQMIDKRETGQTQIGDTVVYATRTDKQAIAPIPIYCAFR